MLAGQLPACVMMAHLIHTVRPAEDLLPLTQHNHRKLYRMPNYT